MLGRAFGVGWPEIRQVSYRLIDNRADAARIPNRSTDLPSGSFWTFLIVLTSVANSAVTRNHRPASQFHRSRVSCRFNPKGKSRKYRGGPSQVNFVHDGNFLSITFFVCWIYDIVFELRYHVWRMILAFDKRHWFYELWAIELVNYISCLVVIICSNFPFKHSV